MQSSLKPIVITALYSFILLALNLAGCTPVNGRAGDSPPSSTSPETEKPVASTPTGVASIQADIVFRNGTILTMDQERPVEQAIAVRGEEILAIGSEEEISSFIGPDTRVVDLQGRTLMPGFIDSHSHVYANTDRTPEGLKQSQ
jgi:hypothetical protein